MNYIGNLKDKKKANEICSRLNTLNIQTQLNYDNEQYIILVSNEADVDKAMDIYRVSVGLPPLKFEIPQEWLEIKKMPMGFLTLNVILISIGLYILSYTDYWDKIQGLLLISSPEEQRHFSKILSGQGWRLITPIFLHFNFFHILFNMMWMKDLGKLIEHEKGSKFFFFFILLIGISSNILQYLVNGPMFGGMSGVVYGLLGYLWIDKTFNEKARFTLPKEDIVLMVVWYVVCLTGIFGPIANIAHGLGLALGMIISLIVAYNKSLKPLSLHLKYALMAISLGALSIIVELFKQS